MQREKIERNRDLQIAIVSTDDDITEFLLLPVVVHEVENPLRTCHVLGVVDHS